MRILKIFRIVLSAISTPFWVVLYLNIEKLAEGRGWDAILKGAMEGKMPGVVSFVLQPWMGITALTIVSFTVGIWADALVRRLDAKKPTREQKIIALGRNCNNVARNAKNIAHSSFIYGRDYPDLLNAYRLIDMDLRDWGIEAPAPRDQGLEKNADMIYRFLAAVGSLLAHNRFDEAKETAAVLLERFSQEQQT